jgi:hypothetical protein
MSTVTVPSNDADRCIACGVPFSSGDRVYDDINNGGTMHAECCGPERECYVNADGDPIADGEPIPQPYGWQPLARSLNLKEVGHS